MSRSTICFRRDSRSKTPGSLTRRHYAFIKNATLPDFLDIRDDRINFYTSFRGRDGRQFYYAVRAVTQGTFSYAPVVAEAMYDGNYRSASGGGRSTGQEIARGKPGNLRASQQLPGRSDV